MISKMIGTLLQKNTKTKVWWAKLIVAFFVSNVFFFILFSEEKESVSPSLPTAWVEIQIMGDLLTPFEKNKKVLLLERKAQHKIEAFLKAIPEDPSGRFTVLVSEEKAQTLLTYPQWEILPYLRNLSFGHQLKGDGHEIRY